MADTQRIWIGLLALLFVVWAFSARGQEHQHVDGSVYRDAVGEFYRTWWRPEMRTWAGQRQYSCCSRNDCQPATIVRKNGRLYVRDHKMAPGADIPLPDSVVESNQPDPRESPDGRSHVCLGQGGTPLCAVLGTDG